MTSTPISAWIMTPGLGLPPHSRVVFPEHNARRPDFKAKQRTPTRDHDKGYVSLPGDDQADHVDVIGVESTELIAFFQRAARSARLIKEEVPKQGRFADGTIDAQKIANTLKNMDSQGFSVNINDVERVLILHLRWIKPEEQKDTSKTADIFLTRKILGLLREGRQVGAKNFLFISKQIAQS